MSTVLNQQVYQGTLVSSSLAWVQSDTTATVTALMSDSDAANPSSQLTLYIAASYDLQGTTWARQASFVWQGGPGNGAPFMSWQPSVSKPPTFVRVEADIPSPLSVGFDLSLS